MAPPFFIRIPFSQAHWRIMLRHFALRKIWNSKVAQTPTFATEFCDRHEDEYLGCIHPQNISPANVLCPFWSDM